MLFLQIYKKGVLFFCGDYELFRLGYQVYSVPTGELLIGMDGKLNPKATLGYSDGPIIIFRIIGRMKFEL